MGLTLDNQTLLYIIIGLFIVQIFVIRYYVQSTVESRINSNNKRFRKALTGDIDTTFDKYVGRNNRTHPRYQKVGQTNQRMDYHKNDGIDSIEDPADNEPKKISQDNDTEIESPDQQEQNEEQNEEQNDEECVTEDN